MTRVLGWVLLMLAPLAASGFETVAVNERVYALVGDLGQRSPANLGHNITSGFVIGDAGVAVIDSGGSRAGAEAIHKAIRKVTDRPVRWVISTGSQDHRWFGNEYFSQQGAKLIASQRAVDDMRERVAAQTESMKNLLGNAFAGTHPMFPTGVVSERTQLHIGGVSLELIPTAGAHTPGEMLVWLPNEQVLFTGDTVYVDRLLGILRVSAPLDWIETLEYIRDVLRPRVVIPGHGPVTDVDHAMRDTYRYLVTLRDRVQARIDAGAFDPVEASEGLDQSEFSYLRNWDDLPFRSANARRMAETLFAREAADPP